MNNPNTYKVYQLISFFTLKHSYNAYFIKSLSHNNEAFMVNLNNKEYQIIHITLDNLDQAFYDKERINKIIELISAGKHLNVLDIHISNEDVTLGNDYETICINENGFYSGKDLSYAYPGINNVVHAVDNSDNEIANIIHQLNINAANIRKQKKNLKAQTRKYLVTYCIIAICIVIFLLSIIIQLNGYSSSAANIVLGSDYKMFTKGLNEYWRLITCAFNHSSLSHLIFNVYSLFIIGRIYESRLGKIKYLILLFGSVLCGSLTIGCFTGNTLCLGISGGIYGLLAFYIMEMIGNNIGFSREFIIMLMINFLMNFMGGVAWQAHLGGAIFGLLFYYMLNADNKNPLIALLLVVVIGLGFKYYKNDNLKPFYGGTDAEVISFYQDIGLNDLAINLNDKLYKIYLKGGK